MTTLIGAVVAIVALYLAFKVLESLLKVIVWVLLLAGGYWLAAPFLGWPPMPDLIDLAWSDIEAVAPGEWVVSLWELLRSVPE